MMKMPYFADKMYSWPTITTLLHKHNNIHVTFPTFYLKNDSFIYDCMLRHKLASVQYSRKNCIV
jgi:hypothetical protein